MDKIETEDASRCESYLHGILCSKRVAGKKEFFRLDAEELRNAISDARRYVSEMSEQIAELEGFSKEQSNGYMLTPSPEALTFYQMLLMTRERQNIAEYERDRLETRLKLLIGSADGLESVATWKTQGQHKLDVKALKIAEPDLYKRFCRESRCRKFLLL